MLYMDTDGTLVIDDRDLPESGWAEWEREEAERMAENQRRYERMREQAEAIAAERDEMLEAARVAEKDALCQLGTLGCIDRCGYEDMAYTGEDARILWLATEDMAEIGWTFDDELLWESL